MNPLRALRERRERKIDEQVDELAHPIAVALADSIGNHEPTYPHDIGKKPKNLSGAEYAERIADNVRRRLARIGLDEVVSYDPQATMEASTKNVEVGDFNWYPEVKDEMKIVFTQN